MYEDKKSNQRQVTCLSICVGFLIALVIFGILWYFFGDFIHTSKIDKARCYEDLPNRDLAN